MVAEPPPVPPGYEFVRVLGRGGFAEVVLARHAGLKRLVAIKKMHRYALADEACLDRFQREARLLARTECPSVVRVYDLCRHDGAAYLVMEHVPGRALSERLVNGPMLAADALVALRDVAEALAAAARHGVVHRDLKPDNVFLLQDGHAKLGDFGLARIASDPSVFRTAGGQGVGTPAYFPPELSLTDAEPDVRSDAYSFAVMAYEVLTGRRPYEANDAVSLMTAHWRLTPPDPETILPGFPRAAAGALLRGLDKDPGGRPLPRALVDELAAVAEHEWPVVHAPVPSAEPSSTRGEPTVHTPHAALPSLLPISAPPHRRARRRTVVSTAAALGLLVVAALVGWALLADDPALAVESVELTADPASGRLRCPGGDVTFTASIRTNGTAGSVEVQWTRPDGLRTAPRVLELSEGEAAAEARLLFSVSGDEPLSGDAVLRVLEPAAFTARHPMRYECTGG